MNEYFREIKVTHWLCVVRQNGALEIYSVADSTTVQQCFQAPHVNLGHRLLVNVSVDDSTTKSTGQPSGIVEVGIFGLGHLHRRPLLMMRTSDFRILIYEAIPAYDGLQPQQLKVRFRKLNHNLLLRETKT